MIFVLGLSNIKGVLIFNAFPRSCSADTKTRKHGGFDFLSFWQADIFSGPPLLICGTAPATINRVGSDSKSNDPVDILRRRYARGEIDKEEFDRRMKDLN